MSPQPLSGFCPGAPTRFSPYVLDTTSTWRALHGFAMGVVTAWSHLELESMYLLATFLKVDYTVVYAMIFNLPPLYRLPAFKGAAMRALETAPENQLLFRRAMKAINKPREIRNQYAHHIWGASSHPKLADAILRVDPIYLATHHAEEHDVVATLDLWRLEASRRMVSGSEEREQIKRRPRDAVPDVMPNPTVREDKIMVYQFHDLYRDGLRVREAAFMMFRLRMVLEGADEDGSIRSELDRELPEILKDTSPPRSSPP